MLESIISLINSLGYGGIFLLMFVETIFPPIPSEVILPFSGFVASQGGLGLGMVIVSATLGSMAGAMGLYGLGKLLKEEHVEYLVKTKGKYIGISAKDLQRAQKWFDSHGYIAVLLCRLLPGIRSLISLPAGMRKLKPLPFFLYSLIGTGIWNVLLAFGGYLLGEEYHRIEKHLEPLGLLVFIALACGLGLLLFRRFKAGKENENKLT